MSDSQSNVRGAVEALLFVSDESVSAARLSRVLDASPGEIETVLVELAEDYRTAERGFQLREVSGGWRLYTHPAHHDVIERYVLSWDTRKLSQAALEALAVVAYHQPVTRAGVNAVRGVNSEGVIASLVEKGLVRESGRDKKQGNAALFETTRVFLERFGLKSLKDLPPLEEFVPDAETKQAIRERLSSGGSQARFRRGAEAEDADADDAGIDNVAVGADADDDGDVGLELID
ncbi:MAG: SMC-Scp complex subunit ScpB [Coriobacteriia bacterium]|nr:SMC-Scp complex subunit ScpB [Coriobacteriia bacterium]